MQTAETTQLFLQYIMRKLRVAGAPVPGGKPAATRWPRCCGRAQWHPVW
jgi:hypothetical protein